MKKTIILLLILSSLTLYSQKWCAPGAEWKYTYDTPFWNIGYVSINYSGDTVIGTVACKKLTKTFHGYDCLTHTYNDYRFNSEYTYEDNGLVYILFEGVFDTLYNFNAVIGDHWGFPKKTFNITICDSNSQFHVLDTGTIIMNSIPLRYLAINSPEAHGYRDTIIEKIGLTNGYMFPFDCCNGATDGNEGGPLRCYSDYNFPTYKPCNYTMDCNYIYTGIKDNEIKIIKISPNPFTDNFFVDISESNTDSHDVEILNLSGKLLLEYRSLTKSQLIYTRNFDSGVYILKIKNQNYSHTRKLVKL